MASFALLLRWLDWRGAALCALVAFASTLLVLPRLGGLSPLSGGRPRPRLPGRHPPRPARRPLPRPSLPETVSISRPRGGASSRSATVSRPSAASPSAAPAFPGTGRKSWSGFGGYVLFGSLGAIVLSSFVAGRVPSLAEGVAFFLAGLAGAAVESLPSELDDNLVPPLAATGALTALLAVAPDRGFPPGSRHVSPAGPSASR